MLAGNVVSQARGHNGVHVLEPVGSRGIVAFYTPSPALAQVVGPAMQYLAILGGTAVN
jgi:hypothetical protein